MSAAMPMYTDHALERIAERFAGVDIDSEYARARRVGRKTRQKIKASCPVSAKTWMRGGFKGRYYLLSRSKIVFVVHAPETVVTVFRLESDIA